MKIVATSDWHGNLPDIPSCDLLLLAGDYFPTNCHKRFNQLQYFDEVLLPHLRAVDCERIIACWGNHDFLGEYMPDWRSRATEPGPKISFLTDKVTEYRGNTICCTPWVRQFYDWAFMLSPPFLEKAHNRLPPCDILVTHGPPEGIGDRTVDGDYAGSPALTKWIEDTQPSLVVNGHIHEGAGHYVRGETDIWNVSLVNDRYRPVNPPQVINE